MRRLADIVVNGALIAAGTILLSRWSYRHPTFFPPLPSSVWDWVESLIGQASDDTAHDAELLVVVSAAFIVSAVVVGVLRWFLMRLWRRSKSGSKV